MPKAYNLTWDDKDWLCQLAMLQLHCIKEMVRTRTDPDMPAVAIQKAERDIYNLRDSI
jgi:hypothetical protein